MAARDLLAAYARSVGVGTPGTPPREQGVPNPKEDETLVAQGLQSVGTPGTPSNRVTRHSDEMLMQFEERAAILEYDEGLPRAEAERLAREQMFGC